MPGVDLTPVYYLVGIGSTVVTGLYATRNYLSKQRDRWISEGSKENALAEKLDANTNAAQANTQAIQALSHEIKDLGQEVKQRLNGHDTRIDRLETVILNRWKETKP